MHAERSIDGVVGLGGRVGTKEACGEGDRVDRPTMARAGLTLAIARGTMLHLSLYLARSLSLGPFSSQKFSRDTVTLNI